MTAYTKLQIIHIGTDVHIRVRGTRGKHLDVCRSQIAQEVYTFTHAVILITIQTFKWESLLNIGKAYL